MEHFSKIRVLVTGIYFTCVVHFENLNSLGVFAASKRVVKRNRKRVFVQSLSSIIIVNDT